MWDTALKFFGRAFSLRHQITWKRYIEQSIVRAIVIFLGEISCRFGRYRFLPVIYRFCFAIYHSSFAIYRFHFAIYHFCFAIYRFCLKRYRSSLSSRYCEIYVHFPKIIYDNDESSSLRSQLFEMASGELNAFNVS